MSANMLRPFHVGKALTSQDGPSSLIRESRVACAHESCAIGQVSWNLAISVLCSYDGRPSSWLPRNPRWPFATLNSVYVCANRSSTKRHSTNRHGSS